MAIKLSFDDRLANYASVIRKQILGTYIPTIDNRVRYVGAVAIVNLGTRDEPKFLTTLIPKYPNRKGKYKWKPNEIVYSNSLGKNVYDNVGVINDDFPFKDQNKIEAKASNVNYFTFHFQNGLIKGDLVYAMDDTGLQLFNQGN